MTDFLAVALGGFLTVVGITHFLVPRYYLSLVPPWVPQARLVVFGSGLVEIAIGIVRVLVNLVYLAWAGVVALSV